VPELGEEEEDEELDFIVDAKTQKRGRPKKNKNVQRKAKPITDSKFARLILVILPSDFIRFGTLFVNGHISFVQLNEVLLRCKDIQTICNAMVDILKVKYWSTVVKRYPTYATDVSLTQ